MKKYTTVRVERETKQDIDRIAAKILIDDGLELDAAEVVKRMTKFFLNTLFPEAGKRNGKEQE